MKAILTIIIVFIILTMIFISEKKHTDEVSELQNERDYWKSLFYEMRDMYYKTKKK